MKLCSRLGLSPCQLRHIPIAFVGPDIRGCQIPRASSKARLTLNGSSFTDRVVVDSRITIPSGARAPICVFQCAAFMATLCAGLVRALRQVARAFNCPFTASLPINAPREPGAMASHHICFDISKRLAQSPKYPSRQIALPEFGLSTMSAVKFHILVGPWITAHLADCARPMV